MQGVTQEIHPQPHAQPAPAIQPTINQFQIDVGISCTELIFLHLSELGVVHMVGAVHSSKNVVRNGCFVLRGELMEIPR